jgi:hypothetical protein
MHSVRRRSIMTAHDETDLPETFGRSASHRVVVE